jgi:acyl-CoA dehydrogenase
MNFELTDRCQALLERLEGFMEEHVYPAEPVWSEQIRLSGSPHYEAPIMEELKAEARRRGLWNLFLADPQWGPGLSNTEYAPLAELMGRSAIASEACNCAAPDTGNMEILHEFGTAEQQAMWLEPLLEGQIRSAFGMTEPGVASSDATNIALRIERDGDEYVLNGRKWWITNAHHPLTKVILVLGESDPSAPPHRRHSLIIVPLNTRGVTVVRDLTVFGYTHREGHGEIDLTDVRVPASNIVGREGDGFAIGQARLGPGRVHHCMRAIGAAERALEMLCRGALSRTTFGKPLSERDNIRDWIAEARIEIEMARLLTMKTAWLMDTRGKAAARVEISAIKVAIPDIAIRVVDRAIQVHGAAGLSGDLPLAAMYQYLRSLRIADGPDEVHKMAIARRELRRHE